MQCVDVAGLQKYAMGQPDTNYDAVRCNAGAEREGQKGQERCVAKIASAGVAAKKAKKLTIAM